jgi:hypothetical protein
VWCCCCCWLLLLAVQTVTACWMWWWVSVGFILSPISVHPFASSQQICRFHVVGCCNSSAKSRKRTRTLSVPLSGFCGLLRFKKKRKKEKRWRWRWQLWG